jgi:hypothetical protein
MHVSGICCDLAKAFDCINHELLLSKLHYVGIQGAMANWFELYLTDRKQTMEIRLPNAIQSGEQQSMEFHKSQF